LETDAERGRKDQGGRGEDAGLEKIDQGKQKQRFMGGKAFGARAELLVDGGPEILEGGEEVNRTTLKKERPSRKNFDAKTDVFLAHKHSV